MEKMDKRFRDELGLHHPAHCLKIVIDKVNEIINWINEHEQARGEHDPK